MSVIITRRDMPKSCMSCELRNISGGCTAGSNIHSNYDEQFKDCPLKCISDLINQIDKGAKCIVTENGVRYVKLLDVNKIIKEYCEMK